MARVGGRTCVPSSAARNRGCRRANLQNGRARAYTPSIRAFAVGWDPEWEIGGELDEEYVDD